MFCWVVLLCCVLVGCRVGCSWLFCAAFLPFARFGVVWVFEGEFALAFVGFVDHLVEIFHCRTLLFGVVEVRAVVAEVVGGSVGGVYHVRRFDEVRVGGSDGLGPDHFGVFVMVVQVEPTLSPVTNGPAVCVMLHRVFLVLAPHETCGVGPAAEPPGSAPSSVYGVPARQPDSRSGV